MAQGVCAQDEDTLSVDSAVIYSFNLPDYYLDSLNQHMDFSLRDVQRYETKNAGFPLLFTGNMWHAAYSPIYRLKTVTPLYRSLNTGFDPYMLHHDNVRYYQTDIPYTSLAYLSGSKREEGVRVVHSRNFGKKLNLSVNLDKIGSQGFYTNQNLITSHFNVSTNFKSRDERYGYIAHYYHNRINANENGGYEDARSFENISEAGLPNLTSASNSLREQGILMKQYFDLGKTVVDTDNYKTFTPHIRLGFDVKYTDAFKRYFDAFPPPAYYGNIYFDSTETRDSVYTRQFEYRPSIGFVKGKNLLKASFGQESIQYGMPYFRVEDYDNQWAGLEYKGRFGKSHGRVKADYGLDGYNAQDLYIDGNLYWSLADSSRPKRAFTLRFNYMSETPNPYYQSYISNHLIWDHELSRQVKYGGELEYRRRRFTLTALADHLENLIYFDGSATPAQTREAINVFGVRGRYLLKLGHFHLDNRIHYQYATNRNVVPLPSMVINESFYYTNDLIGNTMEYRIGVDLFYYTGIAGYDYMPASNQFHLQEGSGQKLGDYPYFDIFLTVRLKRAYFLLKFAHMNEGMAGNGYYQVPNYPVPPTAFKFGIRWILFD